MYLEGMILFIIAKKMFMEGRIFTIIEDSTPKVQEQRRQAYATKKRSQNASYQR